MIHYKKYDCLKNIICLYYIFQINQSQFKKWNNKNSKKIWHSNILYISYKIS